MRIGVTPSKSLAHKQTCLTLYRTLLKQALHLPSHLSKPLLDLVTQRFHLDRTITSPTTIVSALQTARSALTLVHNAATETATNNDPTQSQSQSSSQPETPATRTLTHILTAIQTRALETHTTLLHQHSLRRQTPTPHKLPRIAHLKDTNTQIWSQRIPNPIPILSRPVPQSQLPNPSRPRRVPYLINAQGVPFLRYKAGPQPVKLSHVLRSRARQATNRWDLHDRLIEEVGHGYLEDHWDALVYRFTGVRDGEEIDAAVGEERGIGRGRGITAIRGRGGEPIVEFEGVEGCQSWTESTKEVFEGVKGGIVRMGAERARMARMMKRIVEGERKLAEKEKLERNEERRRRWLESTGQVIDSEDSGVAATTNIHDVREQQTQSSGDEKVTAAPIRRGRDLSRAMSRETDRTAEPGRWKLSSPATSTPSTSRTKRVRRPWDPDWVSKPRK